MPYSFVPEFINPTGSPIRELHKYVGLPGMISFAAGYPDAELFDVDGLGEAAGAAFSDPKVCLQYTATEGLPALKAQLIELMHTRAARVANDELLVTTGSQQGFDFLLRVLVAPGDCVLVENPTYPATLQALALHNAHVVGLAADKDGIDVEALAAWLSANHHQRPVKFLYTVPSFGNPSGATLSLSRRRALLELAVKYRFLIVEDDPYSGLRFSGDQIASVLSLADQVQGGRDWVVHLSSLSKIVAGGLRVGWMVAPREITRRCLIAKQTSDLCSSPWTQAIAAHYLSSNRLAFHLPRILASYQNKCEMLSALLRTAFGKDIEFDQPEGGMFLWPSVTGVDSTVLLQHAIEKKVLFVPGTAFYVEKSVRTNFRLSYATPSQQDLAAGVDRLKLAYDEAKT